jgi:hypothetical protein
VPKAGKSELTNAGASSDIEIRSTRKENEMNLGLDGANLLPEFENLRLNDLSPDMAATSRSDLQLVAALGDEELFRPPRLRLSSARTMAASTHSTRPEYWLTIAPF